ncbi:MAG: redoxin domain-containing protein [Planctomycetota bacterium]
MITPKFKFPVAMLVFAVTLLGSRVPATGGTYDDLVPRHLLGLVHAPEVHEELELTDQQIRDLETLFRSVDARWFPARILPPEKQVAEINELEQQVRDWFRANTSPLQQKRLEQLLYYAQATRMFLREDVAQELGISKAQQDEFAEAARETDKARLELSQTQFGDPSIKSLQEKLAKSMQTERSISDKMLGPAMQAKLAKLVGAPFDPRKLQRIYAMAPEFAEVEHWINSQPLTMSQLRGKVVLVHFYAFQCHNCHANFEIYKRWHKELTDRGVVVVGIQTPETPRERDPQAVSSAAKERRLDFPVLVDLKSENWKAWGNTMWPTVYVVDKNGYIRFWWQGELNWKGATTDKTIEKVVSDLLREPSA